jgi:hypothetical protein
MVFREFAVLAAGAAVEAFDAGASNEKPCNGNLRVFEPP